ncbi:CDP-glycerol glycerophosphotransferase family protein [Photobacterium sp. DNB23_23_1]
MINIKGLIHKFIGNVIDLLWPKEKNSVTLYASTGVLDGNLVCIEAYFKYYYPELKLNVIRGKNTSGLLSNLYNLKRLLSSPILIVDHAIPRFLTNKRRKIYNVWHGIPLKTIRYFDGKRFTDSFLEFESKNLDGLVCSSMLDMAVMSACFQVPPSRCILSGLPRNDLLFHETLDWFTDSSDELLKRMLNGRKLISWMPTYRGTWHEFNEIAAFSHEEEKLLCDFLEANHAVFGIRAHKFSKIQPLPLLAEKGLLVDLNKYELTNSVLKQTDILITDYSSVWIDYALISSNICLYLFDDEEYDDERGTIYPLESVFPGKITYKFSELMYSLTDLVQESNDNIPVASDLFFKHIDNNNTKRFVDYIVNHTDTICFDK